MVRTSIWLSAAVGRLGAFSAFKAFTLTCKIPRRSICPVNIRSFEDSRGWIPLFLQNIGYKKL